MALVVLCGQPCSGKSKVAELLGASFRERGCEVQFVDEPSLHLHRSTSYSDVPSEKATRGALRACVERALSRSVITIFDSLNNIKGYRYELWCLARAAGIKYCMVHVDTPVEMCRSWNVERAADGYTVTVFEDLSSRFERPDARNRWDSPLFTLHPAGSPEDLSNAVEEVVDAMSGTTSSSTQAAGSTQDGPGAGGIGGGEGGREGPESDVWEVGSEMSVSGGPRVKAKSLQPISATMTATLSGTNVLHGMDQAVQDVMEAVMDAQEAAAGGPGGLIRLTPTGRPVLQLDKVVSVAELRRHKRAFLKLATKVMFARLTDASSAQRMFLDYLVSNVAGASLAPGSRSL